MRRDIESLTPVTERAAQIDKLVSDGAKDLLARATENYSLAEALLLPRIKTALEKYLLQDEPEAASSAVAEFIKQLQADDLCLAVACEQGNTTAWNDLVGRYSPTVRSAARAAAGSEDAAEDVAQSIWAELHGLRAREDGRPASKLGYYSGRGSLAGWLRAVVAQLAVDHHRKQSRLVQTEEDADFDRLSADAGDGVEISPIAGAAPNPEAALSEKLERVELEKALAQSIGEMSAEDRLLVKLYYFDNLRLREAGAVLGVHEATASRRLSRIHVDLRRRVEAILIRDHGWTKPETERSFAEVGLHLDAEIEPMLALKGVEGKNLSSD